MNTAELTRRLEDMQKQREGNRFLRMHRQVSHLGANDITASAEVPEYSKTETAIANLYMECVLLADEWGIDLDALCDDLLKARGV